MHASRSFADEHCAAAAQAAEAVILAVQADGLQLLVSELLRALEEPGPRRRAAAALLAVYPGRCAHAEELLEHVPILLDVSSGWRAHAHAHLHDCMHAQVPYLPQVLEVCTRK